MFIRIRFVEAKQGGLSKQALEKTCELSALCIVGAVMREVTFLAQAAQIRMLVVRRVVIQVRGGKNHRTVILGKHPALPL